MKYMGSKRRLWSEISPIILSGRTPNQVYVEPFCGGCNSLCQVDGRRIASDVNPYLIAMLKSLVADKPQIYPISKETYVRARAAYRNNDLTEFSLSDLGWIGFMASFNGKFYDGGYSGNNVESKAGIGPARNYIDEAIRNVLNDIDRLKGVIFKCCSYDELIIPKGSIIYCDPPYRGTTEYTTGGFDYDRFYDWCKRMSNRGNKVYISEYWMPSEFTEIWHKEVKAHVNFEKKKTVQEKLFTI